jgi:predicted  nucleic acid-binding Zn-ribbon protein
LALSTDALKQEREALMGQLREIEAEQREKEAALKDVRQREIRLKREIEAISTLIDIRSPVTE